MWNTSVKIDYIVGHVADAINEYDIRNKEDVFNNVITELHNQFPRCSDSEVLDILSLCINLYSYKKNETSELVITAPDSFKMKLRKTHDVIKELLLGADKSIIITGYSVSDYFSDMLDTIIKKSQQGVYVRLYVNNLGKQKEALSRLLAYQSRFLKVFEYRKQDDDKMAALHAKLLVVDSKKSLVSSANLSYHGMQGNIEMGILLKSGGKAKQIESLMRELQRIKVFAPVSEE